MISSKAFSVGLLLTSLSLGAAAGFVSPLKVPTTAAYNVSAEHKHLFGAHSKSDLNKRTCASYNTAAEGTASAMQTTYYNTGGYYQGGSGGGSAWTDIVRYSISNINTASDRLFCA